MPLRSLILDHIWLKLFSLVLATLIWLAVWANLQHEPLLPRKFGNDGTKIFTFMKRPILVLSDNPDQPPVTIVPPQATITVQGPADLIQGLKDEDIDVFVRVTEKHPLNLQVPVHVRLPAGATLS